MQVAIKDGDLLIRQTTSDQYNIIKSWNMMRWVRSEQNLRGKVSMALLDKLTVFGRLPSNIEAVRAKLHRTADLVNAERSAGEPVPLVRYPVTKALFKHQIRAANMALITFGFNPERSGFEGGGLIQTGKGFGFLFE